MSKIIQAHNRAFKAEWIKLKNSGILWLCLGAAAFIPLIITLVSFFMDTTGAVAESEKWNLFIENNFTSFTGFFFPLFLVLMVVRLVYMEHRSDTWKLMETQPVSKLALFFAKWEVAVLISLFCLLGLLLFSLAGGFALQSFKTESKFSESQIDWSKVLTVILRYWLASWGIISIQYFLGHLIKSFAWPMSIGLFAIIAGSIIVGFGVINWWPYSATSLTSATYNGSINERFLVTHEKLSLLWTVLFLWLTYQLFISRSFGRAFFSSAKRIAFFSSAIILFIVFVWALNKPTVLEKYHTTVVAGVMNTDKKIDQISLLRPPLMDTVLSIPVSDKKFHLQSETELPQGIYYLVAGGQRQKIFIGTNDSIFIKWNISSKSSDFKLSGTRIAENEFLSNRAEGFSYNLKEYAYMHDSKSYAQAVMREWKDGNKRLEKFKTSDRIKLSDDFIAIQRKKLAVELVNLLDNHYAKVHAVYYPNKNLVYPKYIEPIRKEAANAHDVLLSFADYRDYIKESIRKKTGVNDSTFIIQLSEELNSGLAHDFIIYEAAQERLLSLKDSARRNRFLQLVLAKVEMPKVKAKLIEANQRLNNLQRGKEAYNFTAESLSGKEFSLKDLKGRFVVIDVWATWCGPCKKESPYFEDLANRYTRENLAFVSVSVDEDKTAWNREAIFSKDKKLLQLWAKNVDEFGNGFSVVSIPRFIFIDPRGNIINADMPRPSDPEFEEIIVKEAGLNQGF